MQSMRDIKRRIRSVQNTRQITKAMEMVAAAKLRKAQEAAVASRPYADKIREVIAGLAANVRENSHPMLTSRPIKKTGYLVITSDRGLAGGYNANIIRKLTNQLDERHTSRDEYVIFVIGRKGFDILNRRGYPIIESVTGLPDSPSFADIKTIAHKAVQMFADEQFDELYIYYNKFVNAVTQIPTERRLLPLDDLGEVDDTLSAPYEYEPSEEAVLDELLPKYAETLIFNALLEAKASEFGARMTAMGSASDNATELIGTLTLQYNRARQAAITQEIAEIVGGANALA